MTDSNKDEILLPTSPSYLERLKIIGILTSVLALIIYLSQEILPGIIAISPLIAGILAYHFYCLFTETGKKGGKKNFICITNQGIDSCKNGQLNQYLWSEIKCFRVENHSDINGTSLNEYQLLSIIFKDERDSIYISHPRHSSDRLASLFERRMGSSLNLPSDQNLTIQVYLRNGKPHTSSWDPGDSWSPKSGPYN